MLYRIFIYGTSAETGSALAISGINAAIRKNSSAEWDEDCADKALKEFDTSYVVNRINEVLTDTDTGLCKCKATVKYPPEGCIQTGYVYVAASYKNAMQVLPQLYAIAAENDLVLYDAETRKTFYRDLLDVSYISYRNRVQTLHQAICKEMHPLWTIRKIERISEERTEMATYAVTLRKDPEVSFAQRNEQFYSCLKNSLTDKESLICKNKYYTIKTPMYAINFVLEGYKKHPDRIGYVEDGVPCVAPLHRMGADEAYRSIQKLYDTEKKDIFCRMNFTEMKKAYPNPAERFVQSVKITRWQQKQIFDVRYSGIGEYGSEILFHKVPDNFYDDASGISVLKIEEDSASFILPFVEDVYPYFSQRYNLDENHVPYQMLEDIVTRIDEAREMIVHDTFNPALTPYISRFCLSIIDPDYREKAKSTDNAQILYEHRYKAAALLDVFTRWARAQLDTYYDHELFNIQGP